MSVSGPIKDILIVITSVVFFKAPVTLLQVFNDCVGSVFRCTGLLDCWIQHINIWSEPVQTVQI